MRQFYISALKETLKPEVIQQLLKAQFWTKDIPIEYVQRFIKHSLCFGGFSKDTDEQVAFIRVISDYTTYAYITDFVVDPRVQHQGLGRELINSVLTHPDLQGLKTWSCRCTPESRSLLEQAGFTPAVNPRTIIEKENLGIYSSEDFENLHQESRAKMYSRSRL